MKRVYVAGRYSADNVMEVLGNIRRVISVAQTLHKRRVSYVLHGID